MRDEKARSLDSTTPNPGQLSPVSPRRFGLIRMAALAMTVTMLSSSAALAQLSNMAWQVAFDRGLPGGGFFGAITNVGENGPGPGDVTAPFTATGGPGNILSITGTLVGGRDPLVAPALKHRWLIVTGLTATVAPGVITPLGNPNHTIELIACYSFPNYAVGPSHLFGTHIDGSLTVVGGAAPIDFARVENSTYDLLAPFNSCPFTTDPGSPYFYSYAAGLQAPPVVFNSGPATFSGILPSTTVAIAHYFRFTVRQDGDAVILPSSAVAQVMRPPTDVPLLSGVGAIVLLLLLLSIVTVTLMRREPQRG